MRPRLVPFFLSALIASCSADSSSRLVEDDTEESDGDAGGRDVRSDRGGDAAGEDDAEEEDGSEEDGASADAAELIGGGAFGDPCVADADCDSGFCVLDGAQQVCTQYCVADSCPEDWTCRVLLNSGEDAVRICVPERETLCSPCETNLDCGGFGDNCVVVGDSRFCARNCEVTRECPSGFLCDPAFSVDGSNSRQCLPSTGACTCPPDLYGTSRDCVRASELGICRGVEVCEPDLGWSRCTAPMPGAEICDGLDNDCDNLIDEGLDPRPCESTPNPLGSCPGTERCAAAGGWQCDAPTASIELCDGLDNDCDGTIDNGLCYDGNPCTQDLCDPITGGCNFAPFSGPCDDGNACTVGELCVSGTCQGSALSCSDGNDCTSDRCDPIAGCRNEPANGAPCETGNFCTSDTCVGGVCAPGPAVSCGTPDVCLAPSCDPAVGCTTERLSGNRCDDDDPCTTSDQCSNGTCVGGTPYCQGRACSNCSGTWNIALGGTCVELFDSPQCICICF